MFNVQCYVTSFHDFCHDSAKQASLMALAAPKVQRSMFTLFRSAAIGTYTIKVKKSDNSVATPGYTIYVAAYQSNPGGGMDQN